MRNWYLRIIICFLIYSSNYHPLFSQNFPVGFTQKKIASISNGTSLAFAPDGRIFVTDKKGKAWVIKNDTLLTTPFVSLDVSNTGGERGLHNVIFDPNFSSNKYVYFYYTVNSSKPFNRLERFTANGDVALAGSNKVILELEPLTNDIHNGGGMVFGPDGTLYLGVGDDYLFEEAQTLTSHLGKIIRINPDGSTPVGNPYTGSVAKGRIWNNGVRNPYTMSIQPGTNKIFFNDVGGSKFEEINNTTLSGRNFGWPIKEGKSTDPVYANPIYAYPHGANANNKGCAITGGDFINPATSNYPANYHGKYFFIDYCNQWINYIDPTINEPVETNFATGIPPSCVYIKSGPNGNLYYIARGAVGAVFQIVYELNDAPVVLQQPQGKTVNGGELVAFEAAVAGANPITYQWNKNSVKIPGANTTNYVINNAKQTDSGDYTLVATNSFGSVTTNVAKLIVSNNNNAPVASILFPQNGTYVNGGDTVKFQGEANDAEEGKLNPNAFSWEINFHHDQHYHPGPPGIQKSTSGSFITDTLGETAPDVWYRLILTVKDNMGVAGSTSVDVLMNTAEIRLESLPPGLQLHLDGQPETTPHSVRGVVGLFRTVSAPASQVLGTRTYYFSHWENGGKLNQNFRLTTKDTLLRAVYVESQALIPLNSSWKYLDNGTNQNTEWRNVGFNDASWAEGDAELGYGDGNEATVVSFGADANKKHVTTYFRKSFEVTDISAFTDLKLGLVRDDGAVVFLNGKEILRSNMPTGNISYSTLALTDVSGPEESALQTASIDPGLLINGTNVIAVEVHQVKPISSDISFNLSLTATKSVSIKENKKDQNLVVFPNPTSGKVNIQYSSKSKGELLFRVVSLSGQVVMEETHPYTTGAWEKTIDFGSKAKGVYIIEILNGNEKHIEKLVLD